jgi:hypothetical protein
MDCPSTELELTPEQPAEVVEQIATALGPRGGAAAPDPWWQAGLEEQLGQ